MQFLNFFELSVTKLLDHYNRMLKKPGGKEPPYKKDEEYKNYKEFIEARLGLAKKYIENRMFKDGYDALHQMIQGVTVAGGEGRICSKMFANYIDSLTFIDELEELSKNFQKGKKLPTKNSLDRLKDDVDEKFKIYSQNYDKSKGSINPKKHWHTRTALSNAIVSLKNAVAVVNGVIRDTENGDLRQHRTNGLDPFRSPEKTWCMAGAGKCGMR